MNRKIGNLLNILLVGLATTVVCIIGQLFIPAGDQKVLPPNIFAQNGTMPLMFDASVPDLLLRTLMDILAVTVGCLAFPNQRNAKPADRG